jgi:hypothetical protein
MIIDREIKATAIRLAGQYPVLTITGPRQSGKTTLVKSIFKDYQYYSLEDPDVRELALNDPRGFLKQIKGGVILDEIQRSPELLSYIQGLVDNSRKSGQFILTGSHQLELQNSISQSLAGRTGLLKLLPFSIQELKKINKEQSAETYILKGMYPGLYDRKIDHTVFYKNYFETYIERDLRQLIMVKDLRLFRKFVRLSAGRIGQLFSASSMANDVGVSVPTITSWLSILETSFVAFLLEPYFVSTGKRLIKSPKLYFYDTGLASYLLGIETEEQIERDPLKGNLFENFVIMELVKSRYNAGLDHNLNFYRDSNGNEVDVLYSEKGRMVPVEIKSAETFTGDFLKGLNYIHKVFPDKADGGYLVYSGKMEQEIAPFNLINFINTPVIVSK